MVSISLWLVQFACSSRMTSTFLAGNWKNCFCLLSKAVFNRLCFNSSGIFTLTCILFLNASLLSTVGSAEDLFFWAGVLYWFCHYLHSQKFSICSFVFLFLTNPDGSSPQSYVPFFPEELVDSRFLTVDQQFSFLESPSSYFSAYCFRMAIWRCLLLLIAVQDWESCLL